MEQYGAYTILKRKIILCDLLLLIICVPKIIDELKHLENYYSILLLYLSNAPERKKKS